jgi:hypothetical protein
LAYDHIKIQNSLFKSGVWGELTPKACKLYVALCQYYNWREHISKVGAKKLEVTTGLARRSIFRAIKALKDRGLIAVEKLEGLNPLGLNTYRIIDNLIYSINHAKDPKDRDRVRKTLHSALLTLRSAKTWQGIGSERHPNYIYNNYVNIQNSFNQKQKKPGSKTVKKERWVERPTHISGEIEKLLGKGK